MIRRSPLLELEFCRGSSFDFFQLAAVGRGTSCLVRLAAAFAAGQGVRAAVGGEVEFFAVIDDEQGGSGELLFLEAVLELLK